jgi:hypothetical protein
MQKPVTTHEYYCDTDPAWKKVSPTYLVPLANLAAVLHQYPGRTQHAPC